MTTDSAWVDVVLIIIILIFVGIILSLLIGTIRLTLKLLVGEVETGLVKIHLCR